MEGTRTASVSITGEQRSLYSALKTLDLRTRNQVRAILSDDGSNGISLINLLRRKKNGRELVKIEKVLRVQHQGIHNVLPELFPQKIQTSEAYHRLSEIDLDVHIDMLEYLCSERMEALTNLAKMAGNIGRLTLTKCISEASELIGELILHYGNSHFALRKAALIHTLNTEGSLTPEVDELIEEAGAGSNNVIVSSLLNCYQDEQDILNIKRSILGLPNKGIRNRFTRDIARLPFHPHAKNRLDLAELVQSSLQSSLIDAILILKVNKHLFSSNPRPFLECLFSVLEDSSCDIEDIAKIYSREEDAEYLFYKHSSAWLENSQIIKYRLLQDHFYDVPEAPYFSLDEDLMGRIAPWVNIQELSDLVGTKRLTKHRFENLSLIEQSGFLTRSALFNYLNHRNSGFSDIGEAELLAIMGGTSDLAVTINTEHMLNLASNSSSSIAKIILHLLIAKKSKSLGDSHRLRSLLQKLVKSDHNENLVEFVDALSKKSKVVAQYTYDVCTEDFIAKLPYLIKTTAQITETRAALHKWMGENTGDKRFLDRARNLLIDHQINRVRNEIDDNRIYVDAARFSEWINDELIRDLSTIFTTMEHNNTLSAEEDPQLITVVEVAYFNFCSNNIFGIASYLGRRIRHGTFKGHLYSSVIAIANSQKYSLLFKDPVFIDKWERWKGEYERHIDAIIRSSIHVESKTKRDGLLKPTLKAPGKRDIAIACVKSLVKDFITTKSTIGSGSILTEYCWRMIEVDLRSVNAFLKRQKSSLINLELLNELRVGAQLSYATSDLIRDFNRDINRLINEKLTSMHGWFKRPVSVSPKASLSLLYKAVVAEVKETFSDFDITTEYEEEKDIELVGGPYHVLYDAFYVVVYNAAKHGKLNGRVERDFKITKSGDGQLGAAVITITSEIPDSETEKAVIERLKICPTDDIVNAQLSEGRSGLRKLWQLATADENFKILNIDCFNRKVVVQVAYILEHL
ncbi:hypothetical protein JNO13_01845 [Pseudomonas sp. 1079]|nr:hypothetical protein [Pseudomonas sp. 1079]MBN1079662.1 hypothetical protein [Pseudomonas sp. 1079]